MGGNYNTHKLIKQYFPMVFYIILIPTYPSLLTPLVFKVYSELHSNLNIQSWGPQTRVSMCSFCWVWVTSLSVISPSSIHLPTRFMIVHLIALESAISQREYYQRVDKVFVLFVVWFMKGPTNALFSPLLVLLFLYPLIRDSQPCFSFTAASVGFTKTCVEGIY